jgi:hypothetical protein
MIGSRIASGRAKNHKVFSGDADEGCEKHGSFRKVTRSRPANILRPIPGQAPEAGNRDQLNTKGEFPWLWVS